MASITLSGAERRHPDAVRIHRPGLSPYGDRWRARASAGWLSCPHRTTSHRALSSIHGVFPTRPHGIFPPPHARDAQRLAWHGSPGASQVPFFEFLDDGGGTDVQHSRRIANPTGVHGHVDDLLLHFKRLTGIGICQQKGSPTPLTARPAPIALLAFRR